ncbi:MAG TPA: Na+/H+ antiporter NhaA, partial [Labilithrix sp.]|nr:Na+/H+ antiporter NhaA [Labilithrix sp.]
MAQDVKIGTEATMTRARSEVSQLPAPPGASEAVRRWARRLVTPIEAFLHIQAASGVVLIVMAIVSMVIANSSWAGAFHHLLEAPLGIRWGSWSFERPVHFWINDGLMTIFFFVVGLEIRREIYEGELSTIRRALLPFAAALGGMVAPALIFLAFAGRYPESRSGWGIPMATDIAFAVGVLALLGNRVPPALRVLLLSLAIIDDIGGIVVIATFYSSSLDPTGFLVAAGGMGGLLLLQRMGVRPAAAYVLPGIVMWAGGLLSGVHPTIAGVIVGLLTPARPWLSPSAFIDFSRRSAEAVEAELATGESGSVAPSRLAEEASRIELASREALAPATRLQSSLHPWVAFGIMPVFALANAGVTLDKNAVSVSALSAGVVAGLVAGKPIGILAACFLMVKT